MLVLHVRQIVTLLLRHDCEKFYRVLISCSVSLLSKGDFDNSRRHGSLNLAPVITGAEVLARNVPDRSRQRLISEGKHGQ